MVVSYWKLDESVFVWKLLCGDENRLLSFFLKLERTVEAFKKTRVRKGTNTLLEGNLVVPIGSQGNSGLVKLKILLLSAEDHCAITTRVLRITTFNKVCR